jgi:flavodoxin
MKASVVYDSFFGNTERVARAMGEALEPHGTVTVVRVSEVQPAQLTGLDYLIVGSPTRGFRPSPAIKKLIRSFSPHGLRGVGVAAFDTRIDMDDVDSRILPPLVKLFGYAAKPIAQGLQRKGGDLIVPPEGFYVVDTEGPMKAGELERAAEWAGRIVNAM